MGKISKEYHQKYYAERKKEYVRILGGCCVKCGSTENLQFDHIEKDSREFVIAKIMKRKRAFVLQELKKCQLLCDTCHRKKSIIEKSYVGGRLKGEKSNLSKLKEKDVIDIRKRLAQGETCSAISKRYSVTRANIGFIKRRISWAHLED